MESVCRISCLIIGDQGIGKTALKYTQILGKFPDYIPGTGNGPPMTAVVIDGALYEIILLDPHVDPESGKLGSSARIVKERLTLIRQISAHDVPTKRSTDRKSFENIANKWYPEVRERLPNVPVIIAGLKTDQRSEIDSVTFDEGMSFAEKTGAVKYVECSAMLGEGVKEVFEQVAIYGARSIAAGDNIEPERDGNNDNKKKSKKECSIQ